MDNTFGKYTGIPTGICQFLQNKPPTRWFNRELSDLSTQVNDMAAFI